MFRKVQSGSQYHSLFPQVACERVSLGKGDTDYSIDKMVEWIIKHQNQTTKVATKLEKSSLQQTCTAIHEFLYNHFQYKADDSDQLLRSPACAWVQRYDGIDCKSYSILASSILLNLGINHYIRKVAYTVPGQYTHVYVIVPKNQKTNNLDDGFYMIDGTINTMQEPYYLDLKDEYMSLAHYGLNQPQQPQQPLNGINLDSLKKISLNSLKNIISSLACIGGTAYSNHFLNQNIESLHLFFDTAINSFNENLKNGNFEALSEDYTDMAGWSHVFVDGHNLVQNEGGWNPCSFKNMEAFLKVARFFLYQNNQALDGFIDKYFDKTQTGTLTYTNVGLQNQGWTFMESNTGTVTKVKPLYKLTPKNLVTQIPAFEYTAPMIASLETGASLNVQEYLNTLQTIAHVFTPSTSQYGQDGTYTQGDNEYNSDQEPQPTKMGINIVIGGILAFAGYKLLTAANNSKSNKDGK